MDKRIYPFEGPVTEYRYNFRSVSSEKEVLKVVRFSETQLDDIYNLSLLDRLPEGSESTDKTESKNKDMNVVLATVMQIIVDFLDRNPLWIVYIEGSEEKRKRVYQILLNREYDRLHDKFVILGGYDDYTQLEPFERGKKLRLFYDFKAILIMKDTKEPKAAQLAQEYTLVDKKLEKANQRLQNFTTAQIREMMRKAQ